MLTRIKTKEAASQLHISEQAVKVQMQRGVASDRDDHEQRGNEKYLRHLPGVAR